MRVGVRVGVGVGVRVGVGVGVGASVKVRVGVGASVRVGVDVSVRVGMVQSAGKMAQVRVPECSALVITGTIPHCKPAHFSLFYSTASDHDPHPVSLYYRYILLQL
jgi:hypothetical protein